jgi:hypothetical protein
MATQHIGKPGQPVILQEDRFWEQFRPLKNVLGKDHGWNSCFYETYGPEKAYILKMQEIVPRRIWTILECDDSFVLVSGYHYVNAFGYLIADVAVEDGIDYEVRLDD